MRSFCLSALASTVLLAACGAAPGSSGSTPAPVAKGPPAAQYTVAYVAEGKRLFDSGVCIGCHLPGGAGGTNGPSLSDKAWLHGDGSYPQLVSIITDGFNLADLMDQSYRRGMPSRGEDPKTGKKFTDVEVRQVAAYVYSLTNPKPTGD